MKRLLFGLALVAVAASTAGAQTISNITPVIAAANLSTQYSAPCTTTSCVTVSLGGYAGVSVQVSGTFSGTLTFYVSNEPNGGALQAVNLLPATSTTGASTTTAAGYWSGQVRGRYFIVAFTTATSGSPLVSVRATAF